MAKATHIGTCQLCGRQQKLPGGLLAHHGYTVEWGWFQGTCPGAKHLPYEQSCGLVKSRIPQVEREILNAEAAATAAEHAAEHGWVWLKRWEEGTGYNGRYKPGHYFWSLHELADVEWDGIYASVDWYSSRHRFQHTLGYGDIPKLIATSNQRRAKAYRDDAEQLRSYLKWLHERVAGWAKAPLQPAV